MALNEVLLIMYVIDIQYYTIFDDDWGIGIRICKNYDKQFAETLLLNGFLATQFHIGSQKRPHEAYLLAVVFLNYKFFTLYFYNIFLSDKAIFRL